MDSPTIALPHNQDALVEAVAAANPHTIVVLENGGPVAMPWADKVQGICGGLVSGHRRRTIAGQYPVWRSEPVWPAGHQLREERRPIAAPEVPGMNLIHAPGGMPEARRRRPDELPPFDYDATEGLRVGYKWFESEKKEPLFPFGFGLSYTTYQFSDLQASHHEVSFTVRNAGDRAGTEIAQVYAVLPASTGESTFKRLVAWDRVALAAGESKTVTLPLDPLYLSIFDTGKNAFSPRARRLHDPHRFVFGGHAPQRHGPHR